MLAMEAEFWRDCDLVEAISGRLDGRPVIRNSRVEADLVPESIELGQTPEEAASNYRLKLSDVLGVEAYYEARIERAFPAN
jgi:uncharacterized protein (DUF433 family)